MQTMVVDITKRGVVPLVNVTDYDAMSRFFTLTLMDGGTPYTPPDGATYSVWYKNNESHGWYDTITEPDDGTHPAVVADGNVLTVEIAAAATTSCGELAVMITGADGYQLTVTGIMTRSADIPGYDGSEVENYYNVFITEMRENAARAENAADIAVAYGATVEVDEDAQQLNITHHSDTEGGVGWLFGSAVTSSASGAVAAIPDGANDVAVKSLVAEITPVQSGTGDPSPSNIRPISGRTGMTVTAAGKNLYNSAETEQNKWVADTGETSVNGYWLSGFIPLKAGVTYLRPTTGSGRNAYYDTNKQFSQYFQAQNSAITPTSDCYIRFVGQEASYPASGNIQFEVGSTATAYEPYVAQTYPITWETEAGTIYGGTLNVTTGVLTVTKVSRIITDTADIIDATGGTNFRVRTPITDIPLADGVVGYNKQISSVAVYQSNAGMIGSTTGTSQFKAHTSGNIYWYCTGYNTLAATKTFAQDMITAQTPITFVYPLATQYTVQLSPTEIRLLLGGNTIFTDAGSVSVDYVADTKLYIDNKVAELQALILEN